MPTPATIAITPGAGQLLDAVSLVISAQTVVRETMVLADPTSTTELAAVSGGALHVSDATLDACITANVLAVSLPAGQITTLTPPTAAAIGTDVSTDLLIGTQLAAASVPVALPTATITTLTPPTAAAIAAAIVANPPAVTVSGSVGVTQSTSPWVVAGGGTAGTAATGVLTVQGIAAMTPLLVTASFSAPQHVIVDSGTLTTVSTVTAVTSITNPVAVTGTFFQSTQPVSIASGQVASGAFASGSIASGAIASGAIASGAIAAGAAAAGAFADGSVFVRSNAASTFPVTAIGTLTNNNAAPSTNNLGVLPALANAADPTWNEGDLVTASVTLAGYQRVILHAETTKVIGVVRTSDGAGNLLTSNSTTPAGHFALDSNITSILGTAPTTAGFIDIKGADGNVFVRQTTGTNLHVVTDSTSTTAVTQATASNLNAAVVGTKTNNNAAPGATNVGTLPAVANAAAQTWTEGDQVALSVDLSGHQRVVATGAAATGAAVAGNPVLVAGKDNVGNARPFACTAQGLIGTMLNVTAVDAQSNANASIPTDGGGGSGPVITFPLVFNGTTWDRVRSAGVGNAVAATGISAAGAYGEYLSTAPAPTTGQYSALQTDNAGSLFVKNTRRSQTAAQGTTITNSTTATAVTATPAAATFADLSQLIITVTPIAVTAIAFTATLSDGTNTYIYDIDTGVTAAGGGSAISINFNPPLPATSAATGWTVALSVNTVVAHITTVVVLQKAS